MNGNNNAIRNTLFRVLFIGDTKVGKSSLVNTYFNMDFDPDIFPSYSCDNFTKKINFDNRNYTFKIFDMPGQERFRGLTRIYLRNINIIILVFDMTKKETFLQLDHFLEVILENVNINKISFILVGNKSDLSDNWEIREKTGKKFAEILKARFFLSSAKTGAKQFQQFLDDFFENYIRIYNDRINNNNNHEPRVILLDDREININNNRRRGHCC